MMQPERTQHSEARLRTFPACTAATFSASAAPPLPDSTARRQDSLAGQCSTSNGLSNVPDFLHRKDAFNVLGQLILKNLTYEELKQWCLCNGDSLT